jgi:hypothetical protein
MLALELAVGLLFGLRLFQRNDLRLGQHQAFLGARRFITIEQSDLDRSIYTFGLADLAARADHGNNRSVAAGFDARCWSTGCAISAISFLVMALPKELKFSATTTNAPGPPMTFLR